MNTVDIKKTTTPISQAPDKEPVLELLTPTTAVWVDTVMADFDSFLIDHAACERKASGMALSMCTHYPDLPELVRAMSDLAIEELVHYRDVLKWMSLKGLKQLPDEKDPYIGALQKCLGRGRQAYLRDRLLLAAIIEKRGHERFDLVAKALPEGELQQFYHRIAQSEARHYELFLSLASTLCREPNAPEEPASLQQRLNELLDVEAGIVLNLPVRARLH